MKRTMLSLALGMFLLLFIGQNAAVDADSASALGTPSPCYAPDNGSGTVTLPAPCPYVTLDGNPMLIVDGLPPGTTMELDAELDDYSCNHTGGLCSMPLSPGQCEGPGGILGGDVHCFEATLQLEVSGTGTLSGFQRVLLVPVEAEIHTSPRIPGNPVQVCMAEVFRLEGELFGDPDFCIFRVVAGMDYGLPSPGQITLTRRAAAVFEVESFFDITYQIEFAGCPGSVLDGFSGLTTATVRWVQGALYQPWEPGDDHKMHFPQLPDEMGWDVQATAPAVLAEDWTCSETGWVKDIHFWGSWLDEVEGQIDNFDIAICADVPAGIDLPYSHPGEILWQRVIFAYHATAITPATPEGWLDPAIPLVLPMNHQEYFQYDIDLDSLDWFHQEEGTIYWLCVSANLAAVGPQWGWKSSLDSWADVAVWAGAGNPCIAPDNGLGTVTLPAGCPYVALAPLLIIDGLPPGTTMEMDAELTGFSCLHLGGLCSLPLPPGECEMPGGLLGGTGQCFEATLNLHLEGTGMLAGFTRDLSVPVEVEMHAAPRTPGDPVQTFIIDVFRLYGELFGDPDFCVFRIAAGTDYGLPSPGVTTLTRRYDGTYNVESFFDITYRIEFAGCPGSILDGFSGVTTATDRFEQGDDPFSTWHKLSVVSAACEAPDNGTGTVELPADCPFTSPSADMMIIDGLPPGTTMEMLDTLKDFSCNHSGWCSLPLSPGVCEMPGGTLGGDGECFEATLMLYVEGTGSLTGYTRTLSVPVGVEIHTAPRNPGDPVQAFAADLFRLQGELFGDPDFCLFRIHAGTDYGLPSPGQITLTQLPDGDWAVESFFDITYQIEFQGCPGSVIDGYAGTTTATLQWIQGATPGIEELNLAFVITGEADCYCGNPGDVNNDGGDPTPLDVTFLVKKVYKSQDALYDYHGLHNCPYENGDVNGDGGSPTPLDVTFLVKKVYKNQDALCADRCAGCP